MNSQSDGHGQYKIVLVGSVKSDLTDFHQEMMQEGRGPAFLEVLRIVNDRLRWDPHSFGEVLYRLPALKLHVYQGVVNPLVVTFGIHDELPLVFVHVVKLLSDPGK